MSTTEIATRDEQAVAVQAAPPATQPAVSPLIKWAEEAKVIANIAESISKTSFAGALRGKPQEVTAVILAGHELGLKPMASLKSMDIIQGTPALRAHAMRGLVQKQGHQIELLESTPTLCRMRGRRKGQRNWQTVEWTIERAAQLGLVGKPEWKKQPQTMLVARASGELCRLIAADALHGLPYAAEELEGTVHAEIVPARAPLSVAALTAPPAQQPAPAAEQGFTVDRDDDGPDEDEGYADELPLPNEPDPTFPPDTTA